MGFDRAEVDAFLDVLAGDVEALTRENNALKEELKRKDADLAEHRERERTLKETMLTASRLAEDIKQNAQKEGEIVIAQARAQAEQIVQSAHNRLLRVMEDLDELRRQKVQFEASLRSLISSHSKLIDAMAERQAPEEQDMPSLTTHSEEGDDTIGMKRSSILGMREVTVVQEDLLSGRGGDR